MINSDDNLYVQGSVWLAKVYFKNEGRFKIRPVIIVGNELTIEIDVLITPVTSSEPRNEFDIVIEYWEEAGLLNPSVARTSKIASIPSKELIKRLGILHEHDLLMIINQCKELF
jgi:mRNA interferase MazF